MASKGGGGNSNSRGCSGRGFGRGGPKGGRGGSGGRSNFLAGVFCQLCGKEGHMAHRCYKRFDANFTGPPQKTASSATNSSYGVDTNWYMVSERQLLEVAGDECVPYLSTREESSVTLSQVNQCVIRSYRPYFSDVWGPAPTSIGRHQYYVSFIDDFSKFNWIYLLHRKSEVFQCFNEFQNLVER